MHFVNTYKGNGLHLYNDHKNERGDSGWGWGGGGQVAEEERMGGWSSKRVGSRRKLIEVNTVKPVLSGQPLLSSQFSKSQKLLPLMYCNFDLH